MHWEHRTNPVSVHHCRVKKGMRAVGSTCKRMSGKPAAILLAALCAAAALGPMVAAGQAWAGPTDAAAPSPAADPAAQGKSLQVGKVDPPLTLGSKDQGAGHLIYQSMAAVLVILILGGAALVAMKRLMPRIAQVRGKKILLMETFHLGPQKALHLLQVGSQRLLVGVSRENIRLLADVTAAVPPIVAAQGADETRPKFVIPSLGADAPDAGPTGVANA